jgi:S1-C subfamily serine protease
LISRELSSTVRRASALVDLLRHFFGRPLPRMPQEREMHGLGSGVYIGEGFVLTNNHVVETQDPGSTGFRAMDEIKVITDRESPDGGREYAAKVIGNDPQTDVALLRIEGDHVKDLKAAVLGDSDALKVGDHVGTRGG